MDFLINSFEKRKQLIYHSIYLMKNNGKALSISLLLLLGVGFITPSIAKISVKKASAYDTSSLPTTIYLNDCGTSRIRSYYSSLNALSTSERQGTNLLKNLKTILKNGQQYYAYSSGNMIWQIYEIADRDWTKSPASSTTYGTYNAQTNTITNYQYGTSASKSKNNPYLHALYINRNVENQVTAWDNHNQDEWGINREHVWPKALGFDNETTNGGARGDPMHLMAGNGYSNNIHSNYFYGYVDTSKSYTDCGTKYSNQTGNLRGTSKTCNSGTVFEPQDCDKGDIARAIFYMMARYNYLSGSDSDGIDENNPNLEIVNDINAWANKGYTSSTSTTGKIGLLNDLLAWHHADPVDEYEIHRNNLLFNNYTNNRNPFIDFPEWADFIWGTVTYEGSTYISSNSTPTGYATPSSDTINGYNDMVVPTVTSVSLSSGTLNFDLSGVKTATLTATVNGENDPAQTVTWSSSNTSIATVDNDGHVTGIGVGSATITATSTVDDTKSESCTVTVVQSGSQKVVSKSTSTYFETGSIYPSGTTSQAIIDDEAFTITWAKNSGSNIAYTYDNLRFYANHSVTITPKTGYKIVSVVINATSNDYATAIGGSALTSCTKETSESVVTLTPSNQTSPFGFTQAAKAFANYLVVNYVQTAQTLSSITASVDKTYYVGETISSSDIKVIDNMGNRIYSFTFANNGYRFTYSDASSGGSLTNKTFTNAVSYSTFTCSLTVQVQRKEYVEMDSETLTADDFSLIESGSGNRKTNEIVVDDITFEATLSYRYNSFLSLYSNKDGDNYRTDGEIYNTSILPFPITSVSYELDSNPTTPIIEYSEDGSSWSSVNNGNMFYFKISFPDAWNSGYINFTSFSVEIEQKESPSNLANYIMFEDTNNQCTSKFDVAKGYFANLSKSDRARFMTSEDYVINQARTRLEAWARHLNQSITLEDGDYVIGTNNNIISIMKNETDSSTLLVIIVSSISVITLTTFFFVKRKKED